jgi:pyridoxal phosphate enzyme (YggS family)
MSTAAQGFEETQRRVEEAASRAGRARGTVQLIAVSKLKPLEDIRGAYQAGARHFGENYAQELRDKHEALADLQGVRWHAIGPLQTNKAKYVAKAAFAFHALDRLDVAMELSRRRTLGSLDCYIEVNLAKEAPKRGIEPREVGSFADQVRHLPHLRVVGLMCLPPLGASPEASRPYFRELARLAREVGLVGLSMGTTSDFEVAIEEGATAVRVGTAIFGERPARAP